MGCEVFVGGMMVVVVVVEKSEYKSVYIYISALIKTAQLQLDKCNRLVVMVVLQKVVQKNGSANKSANPA